MGFHFSVQRTADMFSKLTAAHRAASAAANTRPIIIVIIPESRHIAVTVQH